MSAELTPTQSDMVRRFAGEPEVSLADLLNIVLRRKGLFIFVFTATFLASIGIALNLPPIFQSRASILVEQQLVSKDLIKSTLTTSAEDRVSEVSRRVINNTTLANIITENNLYPELRQTGLLGAAIGKMRADITIKATPTEVLGDKRYRYNRPPSVQFSIAFRYAHQPEITKLVVDILVDAFLKENVAIRQESTGGTYEFLANEVSRLEREASEKNLRLADFKSKNNGMLPEQVAANNSAIERTERDLEEIDRQTYELRQRELILRSDLSSVNKYIAPTLENEVGEKVLSNQGRIQVLKSTYVTLQSKYSERHPKMQSLRNEIVTLGGTLDFTEFDGRKTLGGAEPTDTGFSKELNPAYVSLSTQIKVIEVDRQSLQAERRALRLRLKELEDRIMTNPPVEAEYNQLQRSYDATLNKLDDMRFKLNAAEIAEKLETSQQGERFTLVDPPYTPGSPVSPNRKQILLLGLMLAAAAGLFAAYLRDKTDRSIYSEKVMERITGIKPLGVIPILPIENESVLFEKTRKQKFILITCSWILLVTALGFVHINIMPLQEALRKITEML